MVTEPNLPDIRIDIVHAEFDGSLKYRYSVLHRSFVVPVGTVPAQGDLGSKEHNDHGNGSHGILL